MQNIVLITYGSHLYGTATEKSDLDIKGVYLPSGKEILLQHVQPVISQKRTKAFGEKNTQSDIDYELYSPSKFFALLAHGQMVALDMLYAPEAALLETSPAWRSMQALAPYILTKQAASFVNYCKVQANKYGLKGARIEAAQILLSMLTKAEGTYGASAKLDLVYNELKEFALQNEFFKMGMQEALPEKYIEYGEIGGKRFLFTGSIKMARAIVKNVLEEYGQRAREAALNEGVDWKALSHAVRIGYQAIEFLKYQHITFPRPEAQHLLAIKHGKIPFIQVALEIDELLVQVEDAKKNSALPEDFDQKIIDDFIEDLYLQQVRRTYP